MSTTVSLSEIYRPIEEALRGVRGTVQQLWTDALQLVDLEAMPSPHVGGKMLRPALCLMAAGALGGSPLNQYSRLAASFEALHLASLAHDDVIDRAFLRRGAPALNALWDNHAAVLGGDYLVARAVEMLCEYDRCVVVAKAITSVRQMAEGELYFFNRDDGQVTEQECIRLAERKTASLFAEACSAPAYLLDLRYRDTLHRLGTSLGIAFQVIDDILDVTQPEDTLGKPSCGDLVEGKSTIPILYLREELDPAGRERLTRFRADGMTDADRAWAVRMAEQTGARERAEALARRYAGDALEQAALLPAGAFRDAMTGVIEFVTVRVS